MGKLNEIQEQVTQSFGNNSFTTKITDTTVEFDSARDSFTFKDEVNVPVIKVDGVQSVPFTAEEKAKLATVTTPMNMKGRVDTAAELPTESVQVGDVYLVGASGSENFEEYICTEISGSPEAPVWENLGHVRVQPDWNQNDATKDDYIKNRICYESTQIFGRAQLDANASFGAGYYTNDCTPIVAGETYDVTVGSTTVKIEAIDDQGTTIIRFEGFTNLGSSFYYNPNGAFGAPNNEKFAFQGGGDPTLWANAAVTIAQSTIVTIDDKFIPDTVARVASLPQADWNQNDNTKVDYIKNRICYEESGLETIFDKTNDSAWFYFNWSKPLVAGQKYYLSIDGGSSEELTAASSGAQGQIVLTFGGGQTFNYYPSGGQGGGDYNGLLNANYPKNYVIKTQGVVVTKIDDKFIPDTVVRTSQLGGVQFKIAGSPATLQASIDGGSTWQTVTLT